MMIPLWLLNPITDQITPVNAYLESGTKYTLSPMHNRNEHPLTWNLGEDLFHSKDEAFEKLFANLNNKIEVIQQRIEKAKIARATSSD